MTDYSVAQFEAQQLEIACLKRERDDLRGEIKQLRGEKETDRKCALYWWRTYRKDKGFPAITSSSNEDEDDACNAAVAEMDAKDATLAACRRLLRELLDNMDDGWLPKLYKTDSWVQRAAEKAGGDA